MRIDPGTGAARGAEAPWTARIESLGVKLPAQRFTTRDWQKAGGGRLARDLERMTGIRERRICSDGEDSYTLGIDAALDCLSRSRHSAQDIEMVISCSISKYKGIESYHFEPPLSLSIKEAIGASTAISFDVSNACAGMMTGFTILNDFIRRGVVRCGMVVSGEYISSIGANARAEAAVPPKDQLASLTVGDSGAAVILERAREGAPGIQVCELVTHAEHVDLCIGKACLTAPGATMVTHAAELQGAAIQAGTHSLEAALNASGVRYGEIDHAIPHQASGRAIRAGARHYRKKFGESPKNVVNNIQLLGNTGSTTHFIALAQRIREGTIQPGDRVLLVTYASGLVVGVIVMTVDVVDAEMHGEQTPSADGRENPAWV